MTRQHQLATLEEIESEIGRELYGRWKAYAEAQYKGSRFRFKGEDAHHAFVYEEITRRYDVYKAARSRGVSE